MTQNNDLEPEFHEKNILQDLLGDLLNIESGLPATFLTMLKSPGLVIDSYFANEKKFVNPFKYTIFILALTTLIGTFFVDYEVIMQKAAEMGSTQSVEDLDANYQKFSEETGVNIIGFMTAMKDVSVAMIAKFSQLVFIVVMAPLLAFSSRLFFRKKKPFFKHHYVMLLYTLATFAVFSILITPLMMSDIPFGIFTFGSIAIQLIFISFAQIRYLNLKGANEYFMSFVSLLVGYIFYTIATLIIQIVGGIILVIVRG